MDAGSSGLRPATKLSIVAASLTVLAMVPIVPRVFLTITLSRATRPLVRLILTKLPSHDRTSDTSDRLISTFEQVPRHHKVARLTSTPIDAAERPKAIETAEPLLLPYESCNA